MAFATLAYDTAVLIPWAFTLGLRDLVFNDSQLPGEGGEAADQL
jgi:hypothetical protein